MDIRLKLVQFTLRTTIVERFVAVRLQFILVDLFVGLQQDTEQNRSDGGNHRRHRQTVRKKVREKADGGRKMEDNQVSFLLFFFFFIIRLNKIKS